MQAGFPRIRRFRIAMHADPLLGSQGDFGFRLVAVLQLNDMQVLNAERIATADDGTHVVGVVQVFQHDGEPPRALRKYLVEPLPALRREKRLQVGQKFAVDGPSLLDFN